MRNTLVIFNYQREIPPFMQTFIHYAGVNAVKKIYYVTPTLHNDNRKLCRCDSLEVLEIDKTGLYKSIVRSIPVLFRRESRSQIQSARENGKGFLQTAKRLEKVNAYSGFFEHAFTRLLQQKMIAIEDTTILSAWYGSEALAAARLKKKYHGLKTVSYAHSFEIDEARDGFVFFAYNIEKQKWLDRVVFISEIMRDRYCRAITRIYPAAQTDNTEVKYLGSIKHYPGVSCQPSTDGVFRLVSCSSIVPVKRVYLIIEALAGYEGTTCIEWTHLGGGSLMESIQQKAAEKLDHKNNVVYRFTGMLKNEIVHAFYREHPVDLFINVSEAEGLPVSLMECMSYGIPAAATDVGGSREIVTEQTGLLLKKACTPQEIMEVIDRFMKMDNETRMRFHNAAIDLWKESFNAEKKVREFVQYLMG